MIRRAELEAAVRTALRRAPVVSILGPRQCGKSTLARRIASAGRVTYFDLDRESDRTRLAAPELTLERCRGLVVLDEVQRIPSLFSLLRVLADRRPLPARFLLLGSASPEIVRGASESLAGRISFIRMGGLHLGEAGTAAHDRLWVRGGLPLAFLARSDARSFTWRTEYVETFLERDVPQFGITIPAAALRRFWTMVAHFHGQIWNGAEFARALGTSEPTARRYLDLLTGALVVRQLQPWWENLGKRQLKSPKIYVRDPGLLHALLGIETLDALEGHAKVGASFEGFVIEQVLARLPGRDAWFWGTQAGAELDLLVMRSGRRIGFEVKHSAAPTLTRSMHIALADLGLDRLLVVHRGRDSFPMARRIEAVAIRDLPVAWR